jgi:hypothetical protein
VLTLRRSDPDGFFIDTGFYSAEEGWEIGARGIPIDEDYMVVAWAKVSVSKFIDPTLDPVTDDAA